MIITGQALMMKWRPVRGGKRKTQKVCKKQINFTKSRGNLKK